MRMNELPLQLSDAERAHDLELDAYNAAFHELGLPWHWDDATYGALQARGACPKARIRHYVETRHPHLLLAYDAEFLATAIEDCRRRQQPRAGHRVDWASVCAVQPGI